MATATDQQPTRTSNNQVNGNCDVPSRWLLIQALRLLLKSLAFCAAVEPAGLKEFPGPITASDERPCRHRREAHVLCLEFHFDELVRFDETIDRPVILRWREVLADGEDLASGVAEIPHDMADLNADNASQIIEAGVTCLAVCGAICTSDDPKASAAQIKKLIPRRD